MRQLLGEFMSSEAIVVAGHDAGAVEESALRVHYLTINSRQEEETWDRFIRLSPNGTFFICLRGDGLSRKSIGTSLTI